MQLFSTLAVTKQCTRREYIVAFNHISQFYGMWYLYIMSGCLCVCACVRECTWLHNMYQELPWINRDNAPVCKRNCTLKWLHTATQLPPSLCVNITTCTSRYVKTVPVRWYVWLFKYLRNFTLHVTWRRCSFQGSSRLSWACRRRNTWYSLPWWVIVLECSL